MSGVVTKEVVASVAARLRPARWLVVVLLSFTFLATGLQEAEAGRRGRVGIAIGAGILGAIILNEAARSEERAAERSYREQRAYRAPSADRQRRRYSNDNASTTGRKKTRTANKGNANKGKAVQQQQDVAASTPAEQETVAGGSSETAATANPASDTSYLPEADRKAASKTSTQPENSRKTAAANPAPVAAETISTADEIKSAQEHLKYLGYDVPAATGSLDPRTKIAIGEFQQSIGAESTGALTYPQLQTLFIKAAGQSKTR